MRNRRRGLPKALFCCALFWVSAHAHQRIESLALHTVQGRFGAFQSPETSSLRFRIQSENATRIEVALFSTPTGGPELMRIKLHRESGTANWSVDVPLEEIRKVIPGTVYYGYRAWGPNWKYDESWHPGSVAGFISDVDAEGNRFNPNKLLMDPDAREHSKDPKTSITEDDSAYMTGPDFRHIDSAPVAPRAVWIEDAPPQLESRITRSLKDDVIYEVHVRGFTMNDPTIPKELRGTFRGAAMKAEYLRSLGVTAIELLPIQEFQNDTNDQTTNTSGINYWGYMTNGYFAPDRRYSSDKRPGGPTREFREMCDTFRRHGIKVLLDVVPNHTGEGFINESKPDTALLYSLRGLDNSSYYQLKEDRRFYQDNTGCGHNINATNPLAIRLMVESMRYFYHLGVDGFRVDLSAILGNVATGSAFKFDANDPRTMLAAIMRDLPVRPDGGGAGLDIIHEPWAIGPGTYQIGNFPKGSAEWNGQFRDAFRRHQNLFNFAKVTPGHLANYFAGSAYLFQKNGRLPQHSINFIVAHDGFTLNDLYSYNSKQNNRPWPYGPSDGGENNNISWDQGGDRLLQRQAARNAIAALVLSAGTPMINGGDEFLRTMLGNNNPYNVDSFANWIDWSKRVENHHFFTFVKEMFRFRMEHPALRRGAYYTGLPQNGSDLPDISWHKPDGKLADSAYFDDPANGFLGFRIDGRGVPGETAKSIYVAYNGFATGVDIEIPSPRSGSKWVRAFDTAAWNEDQSNCERALLPANKYYVHGRSFLVLIEE